MKKLSAWSVALFIFLFSLSALAWTPPAAPTDGFILDQAGVLTASELSNLRTKLAQINTETGNEIAVLVIKSLDGDSIEDAAHATFNTWGIGKKGKDNGILLMISVSDRKMRIETGKGVEGELTDLQSNDILNTKIRPRLKQKDFAGGIDAGVTAIQHTLETRRNGGPAAAPSASGGDTFVVVAICLGLLFLVALIWIARRSGGGGGSSYSGGWSGGSSSSSSSSSSDFGGGSSGGGGSSSDW